MKSKLGKIPFRIGQTASSILYTIFAFSYLLMNMDIVAFLNEEQAEVDRAELIFLAFAGFYLVMNIGFILFGKWKVKDWTWQDLAVSCASTVLSAPVGLFLLIGFFRLA